MSEPGDFAAIVLAAGASSRFGADKLLYPSLMNGETLPLAAHSLAPWLQAYSRITVVTRSDAAQLRNTVEAAIGGEQAQKLGWVSCEDAAEGMAASLRCGIRANLQAAGWLVGLADMPAVPVSAIMQVRAALVSGASIAAPVFQGKRGHPVGFAKRWREQLLALKGDAGARNLLKNNLTAIRLLPVADAGIQFDLDTPADLL